MINSKNRGLSALHRIYKKNPKQNKEVKKECKYVDRTYSCLMSHLAAVVSKRTSGWTLLLLLQQQPWRRLKPQQAGEVPSSHIAHLPHSATITSWSPPQPPDTIFSQRGDNCSADQRSDETASEGKWRMMMMMMMTDVHFLLLLVYTVHRTLMLQGSVILIFHCLL